MSEFQNNFISTIVENQLPDFVRADHPKFVTLLKKYYEHLEAANNAVNVNKQLYNYFDVDETRADLIRYFKTAIIPNFPEETELSTEKLVKSARDFYSKKGTPESLKFLFRVLYGQEIEVYFPKEDILRASDGKWKLPQALRLSIADTLTLIPGGNVNVSVTSANTVNANGINLVQTSITANSIIRIGNEKRTVTSINSAGDYLSVNIPFANTGNAAIYNSKKLYIVNVNEYENFNFNLIERRKGYGQNSKATCIIESAVKTVDKETGREIVEIYVSNIRKPFEINENLIVDYIDENNQPQQFSSSIISLISDINLTRNRTGVLQSGKKYKVGDPVVFFGGLQDTPDAVKAVALVSNVSSGGLKNRILTKSGYYFREHVNSLIQIRSSTGSGANLLISAVFEDGNDAIITTTTNVNTQFAVTATGSSDYIINGNNDPSITLYRGLKYDFNVNASGHPFWIKTNQTAGTGNAYSSGVSNNGTQVGTVTFDVPQDAPSTLYYICQNHATMSGTISIIDLPDDTSNTANIKFNTDALYFKKDILLNDDDGYDFDNVSNRINLTIGAGNTTTTVNLKTATYAASTVNNYYKSFILKVVEGTGSGASPNSAVITQYYGANQIAVLDTALGVAPDGTSKLKIYANSNTEIGRAMSFDVIQLGKIKTVDLIKRGANFESEPTFEVISVYETDYSETAGFYRIPQGQFSNYNKILSSIQLNSSNNSYSSANGFYNGARLFLNTGVNQHYATVVNYIVNDVSLPSMTKTLYLDRNFENNVNPVNIQLYSLFLDYRGDVSTVGKIGAIEVLNGGSGYFANDKVGFVGTGYGAKGVLIVNGDGVVTGVKITDRGEGYTTAPTCVITNANGGTSSGSNAILQAIVLSDGEEILSEVTALGEIQDFNILNRGYDYGSAPNVSIKVADVLTDNLSNNIIIVSGDSVWQGGDGGGTSNANATFKAVIDEIYKPDLTNTVIRVYNYSGTINIAQGLKINTSSQNVTINVLSQNAIISFNDINPAIERSYPVFYGDGLAKANVEFLNGLIKYDGFYLNTDGHVSDKKLQNRDYYHNFSYEIQSEKSLNDYKETVYRTAHPAGMQLLSKFLLKDTIQNEITISSNLHFINVAVSNTSNANAYYTNDVINGNVGSDFANTANVGDLIVINSSDSYSQRQWVRTIIGINPSGDDTLQIETPIGGIGDGRLALSGNSTGVISGNVYPVNYSLRAGDQISFYANGAIRTADVVNSNSSIITFNATVPYSGNNFVYKILPGVQIRKNYKIIKFNSNG